MDLITYKDKVERIIFERKKIYKKELAEKLGIKASNLNRDIDQLIEEQKAGKDRDNKGLFYFSITAIAESETPIQEVSEAPEAEAEPQEKDKIWRGKRVTKAQQMYDYIKKKDCEISNRELIKEFNIPERKLSVYLKPKTATGEVKFRNIGKETFYSLGEMPIETVKRFTKMEMHMKQIEELRRYREHLINEQLSGRTIQERIAVILKFYNFKNHFGTSGVFVCNVTSFTIQDFDAFKTHCREDLHYGPYALTSMVVTLRSYFKFLKSRNYVLKDFLEHEKVPQINSEELEPQPVIDLNDFWDLMKATKDSKYELPHLTLLLIAADTGARVGELATICREHIDFKNGVITILGEKKRRRAGKRVPRILPLSKLTLQYLQKLIFRNRNINEKVFYYSNSEKVEVGTAVFLKPYRHFMDDAHMSAIIRKLRKKAKISKEITIHSIRRWVINILLNGGMREDFISFRVGQEPKNISKITLEYAQMSPEYRQEYDRQYQRAHPLNQPDFIEQFNAIVGGQTA